jgi:hypothetical protein
MTERVELVYFEGCPHVDEARSELRHALRQCGLAPVWQEWDTTRPETPESFRRYGSPAVLVGGVDVTGAAPGSGMGCVMAGAPSAESIVAALERSGP